MKKYFLLFLFAIVAMSCSKKVEFSGKIVNGNPLERIEFIESSGVATLPLVNVGVDKDGNFSGSFDAPKTGMYVMTYGGKEALVFLKKGSKLNISGNGMTFPQEFVITGDNKVDNDFFQATQKYIQEYAPKVNIQEIMMGDEKTMLKGVQKIEADLNKNVDEAVKKFNPSKEVIEWKKIDINSTLLSLMANYEGTQMQIQGNPSFKVSKAVTDYENKLQENKEKMVTTSPAYRSYLLSKLQPEFSKYAESKNPDKTKAPDMSKLFVEFIKGKADIPQLTKDYLLSYVIAQADIRPDSDSKKREAATKLINENIKDAEIKKNLLALQMAVSGNIIGEVAPEVSLIKQDGKSYKFSESKGKPTLVMFYASWNPYIAESTITPLKDVNNFYKSKMNFVFANVDDTKEQFIKTSNSLLKGITGTNVYAEKGMNSDLAKKYGIYGFRLPSFIVIDKDGKIASRPFFNLGDPELVQIMDKLTGLTAPQVNPNIQLQNDLLAPPPPPAPNAEVKPEQTVPVAPAESNKK